MRSQLTICQLPHTGEPRASNDDIQGSQKTLNGSKGVGQTRKNIDFKEWNYSGKTWCLGFINWICKVLNF